MDYTKISVDDKPARLLSGRKIVLGLSLVVPFGFATSLLYKVSSSKYESKGTSLSKNPRGGASAYSWLASSSSINPNDVAGTVVAGVQTNVSPWQNVYVCRAKAEANQKNADYWVGKAIHSNSNQCCYADDSQEWCYSSYDLLIGDYDWVATTSATNPDDVANTIVAGNQTNVDPPQQEYVCRAKAEASWATYYVGKAIPINYNECCYADANKEWCYSSYDILTTR